MPSDQHTRTWRLPAGFASAVELLDAVLENAADGFVLVDRYGNVLWGSPSMRDLLGYDPEDQVGDHVLAFVHPADIEAALPALARVISGETSGDPLKVRVRHADGRWRWVEALVKRVGDQPESGVMLNVRDVTRRVESELARQDSEDRFLAFLQNSQDITVVVDELGEIVWISGKVLDMLGYEPDELIGRGAFDLIAEEYAAEAALRFAEIVDRTVQPAPLLLEVLHRDGSTLPVEALGTALPDEGEGQRILVNIRDARWRIAAEEALRASETRYRTVVQNSYDVVAVIDELGTVKWVTENSAQLLGWEPAEVVGGLGIELVHPDDRELMLHELALFVAGDGVPNPTTVKMRHKDGSWHHIELVGTDLLANPDVAGIALHLRGADDRVAAELRLEHAATHDPLTGLANRALLFDRLDHALARSQRLGLAVGVLFGDLDQFKAVNDRLGHSVGDRLLMLIARRLEEELRPGDTVCRFGGDEFLILCEDMDHPDDADIVAARMQQAIARGFELDGEHVSVGLSIGIAVAKAGQADADDLIREADDAMYRAKAESRDVLPPD